MANFLNRYQVPLLNTEPLHVVFRATVIVGDLANGYYDWTLKNSLVTATPRVDLDPANIYGIDYFTFSADIAGQDYSAAIIDNSAPPGGHKGVPQFHLYVASELGGPILFQPIPLGQFYEEASFPKWKRYSKDISDGGDSLDIGFQGIQNTNQFQGAFEARLQQNQALIGKQSITLTFAFGLIAIKDERFIREYRSPDKGVG